MMTNLPEYIMTRRYSELTDIISYEKRYVNIKVCKKDIILRKSKKNRNKKSRKAVTFREYLTNCQNNRKSVLILSELTVNYMKIFATLT